MREFDGVQKNLSFFFTREFTEPKHVKLEPYIKKIVIELCQ